MTIPLTVPILNNPKSTKERVFIILSSKFPLSLMQIKNQIKIIFNEEVSFQSVRKAVLQLVEDKVLIKEKKKFLFNDEWILSFVKFGNILQKHYLSKNNENSRVEIGKDVTEYNLNSLLDLDFIWNGLIKKAIEEKDSPKKIVFKAKHFWFLLATLAQETELIKDLLERKIEIYYINYGDTNLDKWAVDTYKKIGIHCVIKKKPKEFNQGLNLGVYGNYIIQATHPEEVNQKIDNLFKKTKNMGDTSLHEITNIVSMKASFKLQSIYSPLIAKNIVDEVKKNFV
jgi:hypothetical protein